MFSVIHCYQSSSSISKQPRTDSSITVFDHQCLRIATKKADEAQQQQHRKKKRFIKSFNETPKTRTSNILLSLFSHTIYRARFETNIFAPLCSVFQLFNVENCAWTRSFYEIKQNVGNINNNADALTHAHTSTSFVHLHSHNLKDRWNRQCYKSHRIVKSSWGRMEMSLITQCFFSWILRRRWCAWPCYKW